MIDRTGTPMGTTPTAGGAPALTPATIVRAWKDPDFAATLPAELRALIPANPAGGRRVDHALLTGGAQQARSALMEPAGSSKINGCTTESTCSGSSKINGCTTESTCSGSSKINGCTTQSSCSGSSRINGCTTEATCSGSSRINGCTTEATCSGSSRINGCTTQRDCA